MRSFFGFLSVLCVLLGCQPKSASVPIAEPTTRTDLPLRVAIAKGTSIAEVLPREWGMVSEQPLSLSEITVDQLAEVAKNSDVLILEERWLGTAAVNGLVNALPKAWSEEYEQQVNPPRRLRDEQTRWNSQRLAVSLGSPVPAIVMTQEAKLNAGIESWQAWADAVAAISADQTVPVTAEPWGDGWAAIMFLTRAAADRPNRWLFESAKMEPTLARPEYVAALTQMVDLRKHFPEKHHSPQEIWKAIEAGTLRMAIAVPEGPLERALRFEPLPNQMWPLTGLGRVGCIASGCRQTSGARSLLRWLAGNEGLSASARSQSGLGMNSLADDALGTGNVEYDKQARERLNDATASWPTLRIPGAERYYQSLDRQILQAVDGKVPVVEALAAVVQDWKAITEDLGIERQYNAWMQSQDLPVL